MSVYIYVIYNKYIYIYTVDTDIYKYTFESNF